MSDLQIFCIIWNILKQLKGDEIFKTCHKTNGFFQNSVVESQLSSFARQLQFNPLSSNVNKVIKNIPKSTLNLAANMFIYINACPDVFQAWFMFYQDLFENQPPNHIILILNRLMMSENTREKIGFKMIARKLFDEVETIFSLKYQEIKMITKGKGKANFSNTFNSKGKK